MKKNKSIMFFMLFLVYGSVFCQNTENNPFKGFWYHNSNNGSFIFYFLGSTYQINDTETSQIISYGVFSIEKNQLVLHENGSYNSGINFNYVIPENGVFILSQNIVNTPLNGMWVKMDIQEPAADGVLSNIAGVWETRNNSNIVILRIFPDGAGVCFVCNFNMVLVDSWSIKFVAKNTVSGTFWNIGEVSTNADYILDGNKLKIGSMEYIKK